MPNANKSKLHLFVYVLHVCPHSRWHCCYSWHGDDEYGQISFVTCRLCSCKSTSDLFLGQTLYKPSRPGFIFFLFYCMYGFCYVRFSFISDFPYARSPLYCTICNRPPIKGQHTPVIVRIINIRFCILSPLLYIIYDEAIMKEATENVQEGISVGGATMSLIRYAVDKAVAYYK